jgi:hypothetical protein
MHRARSYSFGRVGPSRFARGCKDRKNPPLRTCLTQRGIRFVSWNQKDSIRMGQVLTGDLPHTPGVVHPTKQGRFMNRPYFGDALTERINRDIRVNPPYYGIFILT